MIITCRLNVIFAERGIKKGDFAREVGIGVNTLSQLCNNHSLPTLEVAYRIAEALGLNVMEIWVIQK